MKTFFDFHENTSEWTILYPEWIMFVQELYNMSGVTTLSKNLMHIAFLCICIAGFLYSCILFLFYRLLLKPLVFGLILVAALPLMGKELIKRHPPISNAINKYHEHHHY